MVAFPSNGLCFKAAAGSTVLTWHETACGGRGSGFSSQAHRRAAVQGSALVVVRLSVCVGLGGEGLCLQYSAKHKSTGLAMQGSLVGV